MMIIVVIVAIIAACCMSSSAAAVVIYFSWADVSKFLGFASPAPAPAASPPSFDNIVAPPPVPKTEGGPAPTPPVPKTEGGPAPTPPVPKTEGGPPAKPVTNPGDFSLANIEYKPVGDFKKDVLGTINALRAIRNVSEPKPLKPVHPLTWDEGLEAGAQIHADINAMSHMHHPDGPGFVGSWEIIADYDPKTLDGLFRMWNEHKLKPHPSHPHVPTAWHCDPGNRECSYTDLFSGNGSVTGHYSSMVHSGSTHIGCATSSKGTWAPLVCQGK
jgi:hypothetical protein